MAKQRSVLEELEQMGLVGKSETNTTPELNGPAVKEAHQKFESASKALVTAVQSMQEAMAAFVAAVEADETPEEEK